MRLLRYSLLVTGACIFAGAAWLAIVARLLHATPQQTVKVLQMNASQSSLFHACWPLFVEASVLYAAAAVGSRFLETNKRALFKRRAHNWALAIVVALAFAAPAQELPALVEELKRGSEASGAELRDLVAAVLTRASEQPDTLSGGGLLTTSPKIIREELGTDGTRVPREAITDPAAWKLEPFDELQRAAAVTGSSQYFVIFERVSVSGDDAWVEYGTDLTPPPAPPGKTILKLCCSIATDRYRKHNGVWSFVGRDKEIAF